MHFQEIIPGYLMVKIIKRVSCEQKIKLWTRGIYTWLEIMKPKSWVVLRQGNKKNVLIGINICLQKMFAVIFRYWLWPILFLTGLLSSFGGVVSRLKSHPLLFLVKLPSRLRSLFQVEWGWKGRCLQDKTEISRWVMRGLCRIHLLCGSGKCLPPVYK